jgi:acetyl/propionyl-CoA carboxylase alpha subunit
VIEETPSPAVGAALRAALFDSARRVAGTVAFDNAATVEFLVDAAGNHFFLEMNTRLQVEHGVTELVTGVDIVAWQIRVAEGRALDASVLEAEPRGHAIEARIYAEDPWDGFRPVAGSITAWRPAEGPGIRMDHAVVEGPLTPEYDPLLGKLMVHAHDRPAAVDRLRRGLDETLVGGLQTDLGFHRWLVDQPDFVSGDYHTDLISGRWQDGPELAEDDAQLAAVAALAGRAFSGADTAARDGRAPDEASTPWSRSARHEALRRWPS